MTVQGGTVTVSLIGGALALLACAIVAGAAPERAQAATDCVINPPANVTASNAPDMASAVVNFLPPTTAGTCAPITCTPPSGSTFSIGTTLVTCSSPTSPPVKGSFTVTVKDTQPPTVAVPANMTVGTDPGKPWATPVFSITVSDNVPGPGFGAVCNHVPASIFPIGTTTVTCVGFDGAGNRTISAFDVTVNDTEPPVFDPISPVIAEVAPGATTGRLDYSLPKAHDNSGLKPAVSCTPAPDAVVALGQTDGTCTATDAAGNAATEPFLVVVRHDAYICHEATVRLDEAKKDLKREKKFGTRAEIRKAKKQVKKAQAAVDLACD